MFLNFGATEPSRFHHTSLVYCQISFLKHCIHFSMPRHTHCIHSLLRRHTDSEYNPFPPHPHRTSQEHRTHKSTLQYQSIHSLCGVIAINNVQSVPHSVSPRRMPPIPTLLQTLQIRVWSLQPLHSGSNLRQFIIYKLCPALL